MPHLRRGVLKIVETSSHLVPMEAPHQLADMMQEFIANLETSDLPETPQYLAFIASERVSPRTREALEKRLAGPEPAEGLLTQTQTATLSALLARVIPQQERQPIDLVRVVMARLKSGKGDGWRYAVLPEDLQAYREGLDRLALLDFAGMNAARQDEVLTELASHKNSPAARWFEGVRGDAVAAYVSHPGTLARMGYSGIGVGGADTIFKGFVNVGIDSPESWEPRAGKDGGAMRPQWANEMKAFSTAEDG